MSTGSSEVHERARAAAIIAISDDGTVTKTVSLDAVQPSWRAVLDAACQQCRDVCGDQLDSIYVFGSVARGCATEGVSDLDLIVLTRSAPSEVRPDWAYDIARRLKRSFTMVSSVELTPKPLADVAVQQSIRYLLKLHALCIYGPDRSKEIPSFRFGPDVAHYRRFIRQDLCKSITKVHLLVTPDSIMAHCRWVMKRILRVGFELVMERVGTLITEIEPCCDCFCMYYPEKGPLMRRVLDLANHPTSDRAPILDIVAAFLNWMPREVDRVFPSSPAIKS